ncbi:hypothetical protein EHW64_19455 [Erwinia psidii]|uniref:hypothetical protein n=1 Tax=Erwinia psidii TaxID=69224 RepID=UPI00226B24CF|nr:hypothetical protein [Erwinia psidii]MCX8963228.1 hypothetical protein [Erwinia psidii]
MSLELALKENTEVMRQLIAAMQGGKTFTPDAPPQPKTDNVEKQPENTAPDIESLDIRTIATLANLFGDKAKNLTAEQIIKARACENGNKRNQFTDALSLALIDCKAVKNAPRSVVLDLCIVMLMHWSHMATITERQSFAELYIKTPYNKRAGLVPAKSETETKATGTPANVDEPDFAAQRKQAEGLILQLAKSGYRNEALAILGKFDALKLTAVPDDKLKEVIALAEKALEG